MNIIIFTFLLIIVILGIVFIISRSKDNLKFKELINDKKKLYSLIGLIIIAIIGVIYFINSNNYVKKFKRYLETIGYNCDGVYIYEDGYKDVEGRYYYCVMTSSNGITKEVKMDKYVKNAFAIDYTEKVKDTYSFSIRGQAYNANKHKQQILYKDEIENKTFRFYPRSNSFYIGEQVTCDNEDKKYKDICEDNKNDVNNAMREFESYFRGAGLKLK